ncbi:MAG: hypothetical protein HWD59_02325 [Coxiellaceae bacterium]|nr:MAG: hypothetical protein HWD59_02325 [Coxiellaceae bacterium]
MQLVNYYRNALTYDHPLIKLEKSLRLLKGEADFLIQKLMTLTTNGAF